MEAALIWLQRPARRRSRAQGFSLIELLIAVAIIMIILAIAIPNLEKVRKNTQATAAEANMRSLATALLQYSTEYPDIGYPPSLKALGPPAPGTPDSSSASGILDATMASAGTAAKQGYLYHYTPAAGKPSNGYVVLATPQGGTGTRSFYMSQDGAIHYSDNTPATASSPVM